MKRKFPLIFLLIMSIESTVFSVDISSNVKNPEDIDLDFFSIVVEMGDSSSFKLTRMLKHADVVCIANLSRNEIGIEVKESSLDDYAHLINYSLSVTSLIFPDKTKLHPSPILLMDKNKNSGRNGSSSKKSPITDGAYLFFLKSFPSSFHLSDNYSYYELPYQGWHAIVSLDKKSNTNRASKLMKQKYNIDVSKDKDDFVVVLKLLSSMVRKENDIVNSMILNEKQKSIYRRIIIIDAPEFIKPEKDDK